MGKWIFCTTIYIDRLRNVYTNLEVRKYYMLHVITLESKKETRKEDYCKRREEEKRNEDRIK